ncbi:hypothetical protein Ade02nite_32650 [Paractinoplanes deccanensis]|uniref:DUF3500 domain-containing protein n=1 Tax=Paractinoplanes deccanensis TaxID=113561 RepID=A0ABQ3Y3P7_9ACTN|nr:DUF3500 domain-containing protein [Actinoplanes deccanensis]GID74624.1 hypothetical protein Ade02nite_32650 [Actinoplanes deccanensis]
MPASHVRRLLYAGAVSLLLLPAGCGSDSDDEAGESSTATASASASATATSSATGATAAVLSAANAFLATLDDTQKTTVQGERTTANLAQWSNLPDQLFERAGLRMDKLSGEQQAAVLAILKAGLSTDGYNQVAGITTADGVLASTATMNLDFGADHYWIRILGTPSATDIWTVQYGGHHLAVNLTMKGDEMTLAPTLWGAQPASYTESSKTVEPLSGETKAAFALVDSLDATQLKAAVLDTAVTEIVLGAGQDGKTLAQEGVQASTFTSEQKTLLQALLSQWITPLVTSESSAKLTAAMTSANLAKTTFGWYGSTTIGNPIYYRVQGPGFTIEFAHQQGQGANAGGVTHIHSIYREPDNDYGASL